MNLAGACLNFFFVLPCRRRQTILHGDWSSDVCSSDLTAVSAGTPFSSICRIVFTCSSGTSPRLWRKRIRSEERRAGKERRGLLYAQDKKDILYTIGIEKQ